MEKGRFARFEQQLEKIVEGSFARLFAGRLQPREVGARLARAMDDAARPASDGSLLAPNVYAVRLNPDDHAALMSAQPDMIRALSDSVIALAQRADMRLATMPHISIDPDRTVPPRTIHVLARHEEPVSRSTQMLQPVNIDPAPLPTIGPHNAQVIVAGTRYVPLDRPVLNIGRRHDNHIVIDDLRVSRLHAQIRLRFGHYVLYDLGSSGGTFVNEHAITESLLKPGDVISLAGVPLVYIEDDASTAGHWAATDTQIRRPAESSDSSQSSTGTMRDVDPTL